MPFRNIISLDKGAPNIISLFKDIVYKILRSSQDYSRLFLEVLLHRISSPSEDSKREFHFLVVKDVSYAKLLPFSAYSLLRFNPEAKIVVHVDSNTVRTCRRSLMFVKREQKQFQYIPLDQHSDPLLVKAKLLLGLQGSCHCYLDVDTRINAPLPSFSRVTLLVSEFLFQENQPWPSILQEMHVRVTPDLAMLNTSFFTWGGHSIKNSEFAFDSWVTRYQNINWLTITSNKEVNAVGLKRLIEQVFFSVHVSTIDYSVLKKSDRVRDGGIIESSYFGASGYRFGS